LNYERDIEKTGSRSKNFVGDRPYRHFDVRISLDELESNIPKVIPYLKNPANLKTYSFLPFLRRDKKVRRFTKIVDSDTGKKSVKITQKLRPIMYASHQDACVYGFYAYILKQEHNRLLIELGLENSVIAYRKIPRIDQPDRNKSNINFAKDVYDVINAQTYASVLCIDIENFFGSMSHKAIKIKWAQLLNLNELPIGHKIVFDSITKYRYIFLYEVLIKLGFGKVVHGKFVYNKKVKRVGMIANPKIYNQQINNKNYIHKNRKLVGIPQGSPISDIIANVYLLEFDSTINNYLAQFKGAIYRRYSDDILVICPQAEAINTYHYISNLLSVEGLSINGTKTELFFINRLKREFLDKTSLIVKNYNKNKQTAQYLGFEFDLTGIHIRSGTIANHYRKLLSKIRASTLRVSNNRSITNNKRPKARDRYAYIKSASKIMNSNRLNDQHKNVRKRTAKLRKRTKAKS